MRSEKIICRRSAAGNVRTINLVGGDVCVWAGGGGEWDGVWWVGCGAGEEGNGRTHPTKTHKKKQRGARNGAEEKETLYIKL